MFMEILVRNFNKSKHCHYLSYEFFICKIMKKYLIGNMLEDFLMSAISCLHISGTNLMEICRRTLQKLVSSICFQMLRRMCLTKKIFSGSKADAAPLWYIIYDIGLYHNWNVSFNASAYMCFSCSHFEPRPWVWSWWQLKLSY